MVNVIFFIYASLKKQPSPQLHYCIYCYIQLNNLYNHTALFLDFLIRLLLKLKLGGTMLEMCEVTMMTFIYRNDKGVA